MKRIALLITYLALVLGSGKTYAQGGIITTVAGCNLCIGSPADGTAATFASFNGLASMCLDTSGAIYVSDIGNSRVRWVNKATNLIYTIAGTTSSGFGGDGGSAATAQLNTPDGIYIDEANNLYIADAGNNRIRKVNISTGIITTFAGGGASTADGVAANTESITNPRCVYADATGNVYLGDGNKIRKVNSTGIITTVAGNGTAGDAGDGGLALSAGIAGPVRSISMDGAGNIYFTTNSRARVRKINVATGVISTVAGGGDCIVDGVPATDALLTVHSCVADAAGNIIIGDVSLQSLRFVQVSTGKIYTIGGGVSATGSGVLNENIPALSAYMYGYSLYLNRSGNYLYYTDSSEWGRKMAYNATVSYPYSRDLFLVNIAKQCSGPTISVNTNYYSTGLTIKTWFGDGGSVVTPLSSACTRGVAYITHTYLTSGTYTIKQVLYDGIMPLDSLHVTYQHTLCNDFKINNFYVNNGICDSFLSAPSNDNPVLAEVDSNGIRIDTFSTTSGFYYTAYGNPGDVYTFKEFNLPGGYNLNCPGTGYQLDTIQNIAFNTEINWLGYTCNATSRFDLAVNAVIPITGVHDQWGNVYVTNNSCEDANATVTLSFDSKYSFDGNARPTPTSVSGNNIIWNISGINAQSSPVDLYYEVWDDLGDLVAGNTVLEHVSVTPIIGDDDTINNNEIIFDTVKAGCDPNEMSVIPADCIPVAGSQLKYTINFMNVGNDTAFNIHVMDTLSDNVDPKSLKIVLASNTMDITQYNDGTHNIVKFDFPQINLLDSSACPQCSGAVIFNINTKPGLPVGATVYNRAGVYFDYNTVVMTNTVENIVGCTGLAVPTLKKSTVQVFPNPATDELIIKMDAGSYSSYTLSNTLGQVIMQQNLNAPQASVNIHALPAGVYYITLQGDKGNLVKKVVKM